MDFGESFQQVEDIAYASLYSAVCPPLLYNGDESVTLNKYFNYLTCLQQEFLEMVEFCFDEYYYPEVLGSLMPYERYRLFRKFKELPMRSTREEVFDASFLYPHGEKLPYGSSFSEFEKRLQTDIKITNQYKEFAKKYNVDKKRLNAMLQIPSYIYTSYNFCTIADILDLEFTLMLEHNIHLRKCKCCGRYFIMKGNYNTNYCDKIV